MLLMPDCLVSYWVSYWVLGLGGGNHCMGVAGQT